MVCVTFSRRNHLVEGGDIVREIRKLAEPDLDSLVRVTVNAYPGFRPENAERHRENFLMAMKEDSSAQYFGVFDGQKLLGSMRLHDFMMQFRSVRIAAGGIGMVAVDLLHKKEKVCMDMLKFFLYRLREQGVSMALLYPFRPDFYKQMGFGFGTKMHKYSIPPAQVPRRSGKENVVFLSAPEKELLRACYNRVLEGSNGLLEKGDYELKRLFANPAFRVVGCLEQGQVTGYLIFSYRGHCPEGFLWNDMVVTEFFWENTRALNQLLAFLNSQADQISRVIFHTQDDNFHFLFSDPRYGLEEIIHPVGQQTNISAAGIMYRVTDIKKAFADLSPHRFSGSDCCLGLHIQDSFIPENCGTYTLSFNMGLAELSEGRSWDVELTLDISEFSSLLAGAVDFDTLVNLGLAEISDPSWVKRIAEVFRPQSKPICLTGF